MKTLLIKTEIDCGEKYCDECQHLYKNPDPPECLLSELESQFLIRKKNGRVLRSKDCLDAEIR
jgi:hypothetical protein